MKHLRTIPILVALAVSAFAGTATAQNPNADLPSPSDPAYLVPAGKVEHTVTTVRVTGTNAVHRYERTEQWLTRTAARTVVKDARSGKVLREITYKPGESRVFDREKNTVRVLKDKGLTTPPWNATLYESALQKAYLEQDYVKVVGETTVGGRRALVVQNKAPKWRSDNPSSKTIAVIDAETFHLHRRTTSDGDLYTEDVIEESYELLDAAAVPRARMAMSKHKGAKVVRKVKR